ncbi:MAG: hypothetical protein R3F59_14920 [Myxococcota bacterium]
MVAGPAARVPVLAAALQRTPWEVALELAELARQGAARETHGVWEALQVPAALHGWSDDQRQAAARALAGALTPGAPGRLAQLLALDDVLAIADEAACRAEACWRAGALQEGRRLLTLALAAVREVQPDHPAQDSLLTLLARFAVADGTLSTLRSARYEILRSGRTPLLRRLMEAWELAQARRTEDATAIVADVPPLDDDELEACRQLIPIRACMASDLDEAEALVAAMSAGARSETLRSRSALALGHLRFLQRRFEEAAALYRRVAEGSVQPTRRASALVNAANAMVEAGHYGSAVASYVDARRIAAALRLVSLEAAARSGERAARYRLGERDAPRVELVDVVELVGDPSVLASTALNEAALAWRRGNLPLGASLAARAARAWDRPQTAAAAKLAEALVASCRGERPVLEAMAADVVSDATAPGWLVWQVVGLTALAGGVAPNMSLSTLPNPRCEAILAPEDVSEVLGRC